MTNPSTDSPRSVTKYTGQDYRFVPTYLRTRDPVSFVAGVDIKPKEQQGHYPITSLWTNVAIVGGKSADKIWGLANIVNNAAHWILLAAGGTGPTLAFLGGTNTTGFPATGVVPNGLGQVTLQSSNASVTIDGSILNTLNFTAAGGGASTNVIGDDGLTTVPSGGGAITFTGVTVANATHAKPVFFARNAASTEELDVQLTTTSTSGAKNINNAGLASFDSSSFAVDAATGFITLVGASAAIEKVGVDTFGGSGTNPVLPTSGLITVTGGQVAAGTTTNVIRTDSLVANTYTIQVQRSQAVASSTIGDNGVSHFSNAQFAVDANGFVTLTGGSGPSMQTDTVDTFTAPAVTNVVSPSSGNITINGALVAGGTHPVRTNSHAVGQFNVEVQTAQAIASTDSTKVGLASFNSTEFSVDGNGFVALTGAGSGGFTVVKLQVFSGSGTYTPTANMKYCHVEMVGGGGGGAGFSNLSSNFQCQSGGGAGEYALGVFSAATIGVSKAVTIGAGGTGGPATINSTGATGGTTSLGVLMTAFGGVGASVIGVSGQSNGGAGGTGGSGATLAYPGQSGGSASYAASGTSGFGASGRFSGGALGFNETNLLTSQNGSNATGFGGGGGGGACFPSGGPPTTATGGNGSGGLVLITEYIST